MIGKGENMDKLTGKKYRLYKRILSIALSIAVLFTSLGLEGLARSVEASTTYTTIYLKDDTAQHWIGNDNAVIELVDNTEGHEHYIMHKDNSTTWSVRVPSTTYNVTFNRLSPDKSTQWNSWSAGGRGSNRNDRSTWHSTYHATVPEHGYWDGEAEYEEGFHEGDVIYLDYYEFNSWEISGALFYVNFTDAAKSDSNGADINIGSADESKYSPVLLDDEIEEQVYTYTVTAEDEGATKLRFWRGNDSTLWNYSVTLSYTDYQAGNNCVKVQGWNDKGYVCPYVPRRHVPVFDTLELNVTGNKKVNRKITLDFNIWGETQYLNTQDTQINIVRVDSDGNEIPDDNEASHVFDDNATEWNHRELIFRRSGTYKITAVATDGVDNFTDEKIINIAEDNPPVAGMNLVNTDTDKVMGEDDFFVRNSQGILNLDIRDESVCEVGDEIASRHCTVYYDANNNGEYEDDEIIHEASGNDTALSQSYDKVGKYMVILGVQETYTDTIPGLITDSDYLKAEVEKEFEIVNQAPSSSMSVKKSKTADIIFTVGSADRDTLSGYAEASEKVKDRLEEQGIEANVSTVSTSALTATDTFAWEEYDHYDYYDWFLPTLDKHIIYDNKDIKMLGYSCDAFNDFLYIDDSESGGKIFDFDLQRDYTDWHSMEGGGFLFNTIVSEEENYIQGYCILATASGLKLVQINRTDLIMFRNNVNYVQDAGRLLQTFPMDNLYDNHHFKVVVEDNSITVYDGETIVINKYILPDDGIDAYGYGPITSHTYHCCEQQSYFTFKNIMMQTVTGQSLSDVVNNHEWTPGENHYVINLSSASVPELSDNDRMSDVSAALISNNVSFYGIGNGTTVNQYNALSNTIDGAGQNIELAGDVSVEDAVEGIVSSITADINSKNYDIEYTIASDEKVEYTDTYSDPEGDDKGEEAWTYEYNPSVFGSDVSGIGTGDIRILNYTSPITIFENTGAYTISHKASDDVTKGNDCLSDYSLWSDEDSYKKLILSHHRPAADISVAATQSKDDSNICLVNVQYSSYDDDHRDDESNGIRKEEFYYKEIGDSRWTSGRFPASVTMGTTYLVKYVVTDMEGTKSRPKVVTVKTNEAREYVEPEDINPPTVKLDVSDTTVEVGNVFYVEASAEDDYGITEFAIRHGDEEIGTTYGRFECSADEPGEYVITVSATDIGGNTVTDTKTVNIIDSSDVTPPVIDITSPSDGSISGDTDIIGTIRDDRKLKSYKVTRTGTAAGDGEEPEPEVIAEGTEEVTDGVIATIVTEETDGQIFRYDITAEDMAGHTATVTLTVRITEDTVDTTAPEAVITDIVPDPENAAVSVYGTVSDETSLAEYTLYVENSDASGQNEPERILIGSGNENITDGILGTIHTEDIAGGTYVLTLKAKDTKGNTCENEARFTYVKGTSGDVIEVDEDINAPVIAADVTAGISDRGLNLVLKGTIDDENLASYSVVTGKADEEGNIPDKINIGSGTEPVYDAAIAEYTYPEYGTGEYKVIVTARDMAGNERTTAYTVAINSKGLIDNGYNGDDAAGRVNLILSKTTANVGETVRGYIAYPETATQVKVTADSADVVINGRTAQITSDVPGEVCVTLSAVVDGETKNITKTVRFFDNSDSVHPTADFISPESDSEINTKTDIYATINDETSLAYYRLEYKLNGTDEYHELATGTESVECTKIGELDTTLLINGSYTLRITAVDNGGNRTFVERIVNVTGDLKVGNMSLGFNDITASVSGVSMAVNRYYDSRNKSSGDFGTGWTLGMQSVTLTESSDINTGYEMIQSGFGFSTKYQIIQTVNHDITVSYGNGTSDKFTVVLTPSQQALIPIYETNVRFVCQTSKNVRLELEGDNSALVYGNQIVFEDYEQIENHSYILTKEDGTQLYISPKYGLTKVVDANGNYVTLNKNGFNHSDGNGILFERDMNGRVTKAVEKNKNGDIVTSVSYVYNDYNDLIMTVDDTGRTVTYSYDNKHNLIEITDPSGKAVARNEYDDEGRLIATIDSEGCRVEYEHNIDGKTEVVKDRLGNSTVYYYDDNGNILKTIDSKNNVIENTYDEDNNLLTKKDALGFVESYTYDDNGHPESYTDKNGNITYYSYNEFGQVTEQINADGTKNYMTYDSSGNMLSESDKAGNIISYAYDTKGNLTQETDVNGNCINYTFDEEGNISSYKDFEGNVTSYIYDVKGNVTQEKIIYADTGHSSITEYEYDQYGNKTATYNNGLLVGSSTYDINGNVIIENDENGNMTEYEYYNSGNIKKIIDSNGYTEEFTYDLNGNKTSYTDKEGNVTNYIYDTLGRVTNIGYANGTSENYVYNGRGEVTQYTNKSGLVESYFYDANGNKIEKTNPISGTIKYSYDSMNQVIEMKDANEAVTKYEYDINGNQTKVTYADNTFEEYKYDNSLNKISYKDREGKEYKYSYDVCGNLISVTDSKDNVTKYKYDSAGNRISEIDANNNETTYTYDSNGNLISKTLPGGQSNTYHYNIYNKLDYAIDYNGNKTTYTYLANGKLKKIESQTGEYKEYEYYDNGTVKSVTTENGIESYSWNNGKLTSKTDVNNESLVYTYDVCDNVKSITSSEGTLIYSYDQLERLKSVTDYNGRVTCYEYDNNGNLIKEILSNGVVTEYEYNNLSELTKVLTTNEADEVISSYTYELGASGERNKVTDNNGNVIEYSYDDSYQLTKEKITSAEGQVSITQYTYDAVGNRTSMNKNGTITNYFYDVNNQLIREGNILYTYDANGNLKTKTDETCVTAYDYNSYNQLVDVAVNGISMVSYKYDTSGNRVYKKTTDAEDRFVFDTNREISQIVTKKTQSDTDIDVYKYVYGDKLISQEVDEQISYYLIDGQLSIRKLIDNSGNVTDNYEYDAFGNLTSSTGTTNNEFLYTSQQHDSKTGLYYLRARYMNPENGRFISRDFYDGNVFEPRTLHKYSYVSNDPVNNYDPQGLWMQKVIQGILAHRFINIKYIIDHPNNIVNRDRKYGGIVGPNGRIRKYVDIIDYTTGEIYEIKPHDGVKNGAKQVGMYLGYILDYHQRGQYFESQSWRLGSSWPKVKQLYPWPLGGSISFWLKEDGLIYYEVDRDNLKEYCKAYAWNMLKMPEFDVGYVDQYAVIMMLAASLPALISLVNQARMVDLTLSCVFI